VSAEDKKINDDTTAEDSTDVPTETTTDPGELTDSTAQELQPSEVDESSEVDEPADVQEPATSEAVTPAEETRSTWPRVLVFAVLPALALVLGGVAGYLKWLDNSVRSEDVVRIESVQVAKDATVKLLSYQPDTVEQDLGSARDLLTGEFRDSYTQLINDVVIPGSKEKQISATATVPAAASVSAEPNKAVVLVFVNQTVVVGADAPTATTSSVQVTMDRVGDRWLISEFNPV
jgi:Mce-associated membrane protein